MNCSAFGRQPAPDLIPRVNASLGRTPFSPRVNTVHPVSGAVGGEQDALLSPAHVLRATPPAFIPPSMTSSVPVT
jgi:hypothetical protein